MEKTVTPLALIASSIWDLADILTGDACLVAKVADFVRAEEEAKDLTAKVEELAERK